MTHTFKLSRRTARLRSASLVSLLVLGGACDSADSFEPTTSAEFIEQPSFAITSSNITISNISARSGKTYRLLWDLTTTDRSYTDRSYTFTSVPSAVVGFPLIQTANDDKAAYLGSTSFLTFDISTDANVYVGHDNRVARPTWLTSSFKDTGLDLVSSDGVTRYSLFKKTFVKGRVTLGSNAQSSPGSDVSMYVVAVEPIATSAPTSPTPIPAPEPIITTGGIPFGLFNMPNDIHGSTYNGAVRYIWPEYLLSNLKEIKARGGKVVLSFFGAKTNLVDSYGNFSYTKWKALVDRYKGINFDSYVTDGTIIGHYLIDEPSDKEDWNGKTVPQATIESMAKYSKSLWPNMPTIVRDWPTYMDDYTGTYTYLDAAWAQYRVSKGVVTTVLANEVKAAQAKGLGLIVGLNILRGGTNGGQMTAAQVESFGTTLLGSSYPCGFMSWEYNSTYLAKSDVKTAMSRLRSLATNRSAKSCR